MNLLVFFNLVNDLAADLACFKSRRSYLPFICRYFLLLSPFLPFLVSSEMKRQKFFGHLIMQEDKNALILFY